MKGLGRFSLYLGNMFYHYDSSLFGWIAPFLAPVLFPQMTQGESLLWTFAFLPLSYLTKPIGSYFWGYLGDHWGRRPVVCCSLLGTAVSTFAIGCLPIHPFSWI